MRCGGMTSEHKHQFHFLNPNSFRKAFGTSVLVHQRPRPEPAQITSIETGQVLLQLLLSFGRPSPGVIVPVLLC